MSVHNEIFVCAKNIKRLKVIQAIKKSPIPAYSPSYALNFVACRIFLRAKIVKIVTFKIFKPHNR